MKRIKILIAFAVVLIFSNNTNAQSWNHITHTIGSMNIGGTNVTVTQSGCLDVFTTYCPHITTPYIIGFNANNSSFCSGAYAFQFSPPLDSLKLNFSGITHVQNHQEIIMLNINGSHYPIPSAGSANNCDSMAVLDPNGNIAGCNDCIEAGWVGTKIYGPISELIVTDSVIIGLPGGSLFSLFISDVAINDLEEISASKLQVYPNPFVDALKVNTQSEGTIIIHDVSGNEVLTQRIKTGNSSIKTQDLPSGAYIIKFLSDNGSIKFQKIIRQ
jgi:hypothetical protein